MKALSADGGAAVSEPVLRVSNLTKRYGALTAVRDASFDVFEQDVFGFLGPNGAGKTTTFSILAGLIKPTSGSISVFGRKHMDLDARSKVGMLIETPAFYEYLSGRKNLEILARLSPGGNGAVTVDSRRIDEVLELVELSGRARDKVGKYSHGMRQRLGIAQALLARPRLLVLDEPSNGLDPDGSVRMWSLLRHLAAEEKMTIVVSSHLLHEVEESCNRIAVINEGMIVACDEVRRLLFFSKEDSLVVFDSQERRVTAEIFLRAREGVEVLLSGAEAAGTWSGSPAEGASPRASVPVPTVPGEEHAIRIRLQQGETAALIEALVAQGLTPRAVIPQRKTLRQFFLELTRRQPERPPLQ